MKENKEFSKKVDEFARLYEMKEALMETRKELLPATFWILTSEEHISQLKGFGYKNFKKTVALNYFTWVIKRKKIWKEDQMNFLLHNLPLISIISNAFRAFKATFTNKFEQLSFFRFLVYNFHVYLLWDFVSRIDSEHILEKIYEPIEGNPPRIYLKKKLISQDLANAVLEYISIMLKIEKNEIQSIMELGAGYGRTAYVFLKMHPNLRYIIVDIPPALYIVEKYFSNQFKERKILKFRKFKDFSEIKEEFEQADIAFFLPYQLELLPSNISDLFINISSFHEMRPNQIEFYFQCIDKLIKKYVYIKQWKKTKLAYEDVWISENDYPIRKSWKQIFWQECKVKTSFFEALFELKNE